MLPRRNDVMPSVHRARALLAAAVIGTSVFARPCAAQSLRGSKASVDRMYRHARAEGLTFYSTSRSVRRAVSSGQLVRLSPNGDFTLHRVSFPYARPTTRTFVERLAAEYHGQCGEPLEVTSAVRPESRQPENSVARSVHPAGIAVDLHKPTDASCLHWLRETLLSLESDGTIEVTEEFNPPHFHVAVFPTPYRRYVRSQTASDDDVTLASSGARNTTTYRVRAGDTIWDIARAHDTTVEAITAANHLTSTVIQPGDELLIPAGG